MSPGGTGVAVMAPDGPTVGVGAAFPDAVCWMPSRPGSDTAATGTVVRTCPPLHPRLVASSTAGSSMRSCTGCAAADEASIEAVTGSGKTDVAIAAAADALRRGRFVLVVVPSRVLMEQWHGRLTAALPAARIGRLGDSGTRRVRTRLRRARRDPALGRGAQAGARRDRAAGC